MGRPKANIGASGSSTVINFLILRKNSLRSDDYLITIHALDCGAPIRFYFTEDKLMSRVASAPTASPMQGQVPHEKLPHEKSAMRAYDKWCHRGRPHGTHPP